MIAGTTSVEEAAGPELLKGSATPSENGSNGAAKHDAPAVPDPSLAGFDSLERLLEVRLGLTTAACLGIGLSQRQQAAASNALASG